MHKYLAMLFCAMALTAASCGERESPWFERIKSSDFGLGINLEDTPDRVHSVLGDPTTTSEVQAGFNVEEFWFSPALQTKAPDTPQLSMNFHDGRLMRLHNAYDVLDPDLPEPPFIMEPVTDIKLGIRRTRFIDILGPPAESVINDTWNFAGPEGRRIVLTAEFKEKESTGEQICTRLQVVLVDAVPLQRGEEYERQQ
jgi:hypothetical protein